MKLTARDTYGAVGSSNHAGYSTGIDMNDTDLMHIVDVTDTTQDPAGSSFKQTLGAFKQYFQNGSPNLYNINGALTGDRTITMGAYKINFSGNNVAIGYAAINNDAKLDVSGVLNGYSARFFTNAGAGDIRRFAVHASGVAVNLTAAPSADFHGKGAWRWDGTGSTNQFSFDGLDSFGFGDTAISGTKVHIKQTAGTALRIDDGTALTGYVWTATNNNGDGVWQAATGNTYTGSDGILIDISNNITLDNAYFSGDISVAAGAVTVGWTGGYTTYDARYLKLSGGTMFGDILFTGGKGIDTTATGGTDTLNVGVTNADVINIGTGSNPKVINVGSSSTMLDQINIYGSIINQNVTNVAVADKLVRYNVGGAAASGFGSGFEIEENAVITGYFKTNGARTGYTMLAPAQAATADILLSSLSANRIYTLPNVSGTFITTGDTGTVTNAMLANSKVTIGSTDVSLGATVTTFAGLVSVTSTGFTGALTGNASTATALQTARTINTVAFDGTGNITITAAAGTLTGATLASGVTASSLTSFGNSPAFVTPTLGVASATSLSITGTGGAGFVDLISQATPPAANNGSIRLYYDNSIGLSWTKRNAGNTADITRSFVAPDSSVVYTLPTATSTLVATTVTTLSSLVSVSTITTGGLGTGATIGNVTMNLTSTAVGDIYYAGAAGALTRLAAGAAGTFLRFAGVTTAPVVSTLVLPNSATANRISYSTSTNTLGEDTNFTWSGSLFLAGLTAAVASGDVCNMYRNQNDATYIRVINNTTGTVAQAGFVASPNNGTTSVSLVAFNSSYSTSSSNIANAGVLRSNLSAGLVLSAGAAAPVIFFSNNTDRGRILSTGEWGIGLTAPTALLHVSQTAAATGTIKALIIASAINTNQTLSTEISSVNFTNSGRQWATGAIATQREVLFTAPTYSFVGASTITDCATVAIVAAPIAGTNATLTRSMALWVQAGQSRFDGQALFGSGIAADGGGVKHQRITTGSVAGGSTALITITWTTAFADANYTVNASVLEATTSSLSISVVHIESQTAAAVTVRVINNAIGALTGTVHITAIHD